MKIEWESLEEMKSFVIHYDFSEIIRHSVPWGGLGLNIKEKYDYGNDSDSEKTCSESCVIGDSVIITPYCSELSWLARELMGYYRTHKKYSDEIFTIQMCKASEAFFVIHHDYYAKELLLFVLDWIIRSETMGEEEIWLRKNNRYE